MTGRHVSLFFNGSNFQMKHFTKKLLSWHPSSKKRSNGETLNQQVLSILKLMVYELRRQNPVWLL
jgi:hypothetical protein